MFTYNLDVIEIEIRDIMMLIMVLEPRQEDRETPSCQADLVIPWAKYGCMLQRIKQTFWGLSARSDL